MISDALLDKEVRFEATPHEIGALTTKTLREFQAFGWVGPLMGVQSWKEYREIKKQLQENLRYANVQAQFYGWGENYFPKQYEKDMKRIAKKR